MRTLLIALLMTLATQVGAELAPPKDPFAFREEANCKKSSPFIQGLVEQCLIAREPTDLEILNGLVALLSEMDHMDDSCLKFEIKLCDEQYLSLSYDLVLAKMIEQLKLELSRYFPEESVGCYLKEEIFYEKLKSKFSKEEVDKVWEINNLYCEVIGAHVIRD